MERISAGPGGLGSRMNETARAGGLAMGIKRFQRSQFGFGAAFANRDP